jgi:hypothetical protein
MATEIIFQLESAKTLEAERNRKMEEQLRQLQLGIHDPPTSKGTNEPDYLWITGFQPDISHRRLISYGGYGEVHEVLPFCTFFDL